ncbi:hypothetical protein GCM10010988_29320 [Cnuibacter physcomitrellae]|nr:hypothetical protein GCM10010988_29320 [Cnuibacter physcomitrellae]
MQVPSVAAEIATDVAVSPDPVEDDEDDESVGTCPLITVTQEPTVTSARVALTLAEIVVDSEYVTAVCDDASCTWSVVPLRAAISPDVPPPGKPEPPPPGGAEVADDDDEDVDASVAAQAARAKMPAQASRTPAETATVRLFVIMGCSIREDEGREEEGRLLAA